MLRTKRLAELPHAWDIIVVGGGITGAGVFREASRAGYRTLLVEQRDFAWGTSSRSGKLVHGGLRYLGQGQIRTTFHSVRERERLLKRYPGLVEELTFAVPIYDRLSRWMVKTGLTIYDGLAFRRSHRYHNRLELLKRIPQVKRENLLGGFFFRDAWTDDARLVLRVIREGEALGGKALNYMQVEELLRDKQGRVKGVVVRDSLDGKVRELFAGAVVNAAGVWADKLREAFGEKPRLRKLRGSHLLLPFERLPLKQAVSFSHPADHRPLYAMPWQGKTLVGTTDLDHEESLNKDPEMSGYEGNYLLTGVGHSFPDCQIQAKDVISTFAGVRPVLNTGKSDPSKESRDYVIWSQESLVTVTGGKLTTFPLLARKALKETVKYLSSQSCQSGSAGNRDEITNKAAAGRHLAEEAEGPQSGANSRSGGKDYFGLDYLSQIEENKLEAVLHLRSLYGEEARGLIAHMEDENSWEQIPGSGVLWAELVRSAQKEQVVHLEDLLLRRTRLGLLLPEGGEGILTEVQKRISPVLDWSEQRWVEEKANYQKLWQQAYSPRVLKHS